MLAVLARHGNISIIKDRRSITAEGKANKAGSDLVFCLTVVGTLCYDTDIVHSGRMSRRLCVYGNVIICGIFLVRESRINNIQTAFVLHFVAIGLEAVLHAGDLGSLLSRCIRHHLVVDILRCTCNTVNACIVSMIVCTSRYRCGARLFIRRYALDRPGVVSIIYGLLTRDIRIPRIDHGIRSTQGRVNAGIKVCDISRNAVACGKNVHIVGVYGYGCFPIVRQGKASSAHKRFANHCQAKLNGAGSSVSVSAVVNDDHSRAVTGLNGCGGTNVAGNDVHVRLGTDACAVPVNDVEDNVKRGGGIFPIIVHGELHIPLDIGGVSPCGLVLLVV